MEFDIISDISEKVVAILSNQRYNEQNITLQNCRYAADFCK